MSVCVLAAVIEKCSARLSGFTHDVNTLIVGLKYTFLSMH